MMTRPDRVIVGITGATGTSYGVRPSASCAA